MRKILIWVLAVFITIGAAVYQRISGPSYPITGHYTVNGTKYPFRLERSHGGAGDQEVSIRCPEDAQGTVFWRLYPSDHPFKPIKMKHLNSNMLTAKLPHQPPAGKIEYYISLSFHGNTLMIPENKHVVIRFKGRVPPAILITHIILMFAAMLTSNRVALEILFKGDKTRGLTYFTFGGLVAGGLILGCIVQYYAFGQAWTGFPVGHDLTDNKLAVAVLIWAVPVYQSLRKRDNRKWVLIAAATLFLVYIIPHSMFGSELEVK